MPYRLFIVTNVKDWKLTEEIPVFLYNRREYAEKRYCEYIQKVHNKISGIL